MLWKILVTEDNGIQYSSIMMFFFKIVNLQKFDRKINQKHKYIGLVWQF